MQPDDAVTRAAVCDVIARYAHAFDRGEHEAAAALFTVDGVLEVEGGNRTAGRDAINERFAAAAARLRAAGDGAFVRHLVGSTVVEPHGAEAEAWSYFVVLTESGVDHWGRYQDHLRLEGERWVLTDRRVVIEGRARPSRLT